MSDQTPEAAAASQASELATLTYSIGRLDRAVRQRLGAILAPHDLSIAQFTTLSVLRRRSGLSNAQLARRALILPQSMIQVLLSLERRGLVVREPDPAHNRVLRARLTPEGDCLLDAAARAADALEARLVAIAGQSDAQLAAEVMQTWVRELARDA